MMGSINLENIYSYSRTHMLCSFSLASWRVEFEHICVYDARSEFEKNLKWTFIYAIQFHISQVRGMWILIRLKYQSRQNVNKIQEGEEETHLFACIWRETLTWISVPSTCCPTELKSKYFHRLN